MILSVCGYTCSGSSAVVHLLKEYSETNIINFECMLLDLPDGIKDLDYACHSGGSYFREDRAFQRFINSIHNNRYLQKYSNGKIDEIAKRYVDDLTAVEWQGRSVYDYTYNDTIEKYFWFMRRAIEKVVYKGLKKTTLPLTNRCMRIYDRNVDFYQTTKQFMNDAVVAFGGDLNRINVMDQLMPPIDTQEYLKYVEGGKAIIVDRDPRDMYLNLILGVDCRCTPTTAEEFVKYHKAWWKSEKKDTENILHINFEDLIYKYEETLAKIEFFLGLGSPTKHGKIFRPERSINNTQIFTRINGYEKDIALIESELEDYLYGFPADSMQQLTKEYMYVTQHGDENQKWKIK